MNMVKLDGWSLAMAEVAVAGVVLRHSGGKVWPRVQV